jgi:hypothetical protein
MDNTARTNDRGGALNARSHSRFDLRFQLYPTSEEHKGASSASRSRTRAPRTLLVETDGSAAAVRTLLRASGVTDAVAFEAGSGALTPHGRGGAELLRDAYPSTTLFVVGAPMPPGVLRLGGRAPISPLGR